MIGFFNLQLVQLLTESIQHKEASVGASGAENIPLGSTGSFAGDCAAAGEGSPPRAA